MAKKTFILCLAALAVAAFVFGLTACSGDSQIAGVRKEFTDSMYSETAPAWREQALIAEGYTYTGEGITLDGKMDEAAWSEVYPLTYTSVGVTVSVYVVFGEDGFYVAYDVKDTEAYFHDDRSSENNSSVEIYFSPVTSTALDGSVLQIRMEPNNDISCYRALGDGTAQLSYPWSMGYLPVYGLASAENGWTVDEEEGWTTHGPLQYEMFIGWEALSLDSAPASMKLYPCYNYVNSASEDAKRVSQVWPQGRYNEPIDYYVFDAEGYVNNDDRLAQEYGDLLLGDAGNGLSKSSAWDLSALQSSGVVSTTANARGSHYIYVKDRAEEAYLFSTKAYFVDDVNNSGARIGIVLGRRNSGKTDLNMYTEALAVAVQGSNVGKYQLTTKVGDDEGGKSISWVNSTLTSFSGNNGASAGSPVELTVVKQGSMFFYFINGRYVNTLVKEDFSGGCAVGLYTLGAQAVFSDLEYSTDESAIEEYLDAANIRIVTVTAGAGGSFRGTAGDTALSAEQNIAAFVGSADVSLTVLPNIDAARTYVIGKVTVNGEERALAAGGVLQLSGCSESMDIVIEFTAVTQGAQIEFAGGTAQVTIAQQDGINNYTFNVADGLRVRLADGTWNITPEGGAAVTVVVENGIIVQGNATIDVG